MKIHLLFISLLTAASDHTNGETEACNLSQEKKSEIASYAPVAEKIIGEILYGKFKGTTYKHLADFVDQFGSRLAGSLNLEYATDYMLNKSVEFNLDNVHGEEVSIPQWVRENESATLLEPRYQLLTMLGLGDSIGTSPEGILAEGLVVTFFNELEKMSSRVNGKIVIFNQEYENYEETNNYRMLGAVKASTYGAVAVLICSVTPFSLNTPHTGLQMYTENITKIPAACITIEDAMMLKRIQDRGEKMEAKYLPPTTSKNFISEIIGSDQPEKVVVISGHLDSWDVGKGALDDGGGAILSWNSLVVLKALNLRPRRTIRAILWTAEEIGLLGASAYVKAHEDEIKNLNFVMESDEGTFTPYSLQFSGLPEAACILHEILNLLQSINATNLTQPTNSAPDLTAWVARGVPGANLLNDNERYFWFYHSAGDTMEVQNSSELDKSAALWATVAYIIADLSFDLPKKLNANYLR